MSLLTEKTLSQKATDRFDQLTIESARGLHHAAVIMRANHRAFWAQADDELLAALNADSQLTADRFQRNSEIGAAINSQLDALDLPEFPARVPVTLGRSDVVVDTETGAWSISS